MGGESTSIPLPLLLPLESSLPFCDIPPSPPPSLPSLSLKLNNNLFSFFFLAVSKKSLLPPGGAGVVPTMLLLLLMAGGGLGVCCEGRRKPCAKRWRVVVPMRAGEGLDFLLDSCAVVVVVAAVAVCLSFATTSSIIASPSSFFSSSPSSFSSLVSS